MGKKAQVTVFIIIGIIILVIFGLVSNYRQTSSEQKTNLDTGMSSDVNSVKSYTENCIKKTLENGLVDVGFNNITRLEEYINDRLDGCINNFDAFEGLEIIEGNAASDIILSTNNLNLIVNLNYPLIIKKQGLTSKISDFHINYALTSQVNLQVSNGLVGSQISVYSRNMVAILDVPAGVSATKDGVPINNVSITIRDNIQNSGNTIGFLAYDLEPSGAQFNPPLQLRIEYNESNLPAGTDEEDIKISYFNNQMWINLPSWVDEYENIVYANISHFTETSLTLDHNTIESVGSEEAVSSAGYPRAASIAVDIQNQPHIVTENDGINAYHKIGSQWIIQEPLFATTIAVPHIEIDEYDRAWIASSNMENDGTVYNYDMGGRGKCCNAMALLGDVSTSPTILWGPEKINTGFTQSMSTGSNDPDHAYQYDGNAGIVKWDKDGVPTNSGIFAANSGGEKCAIGISSVEGTGQEVIVHTAIGGYRSRNPSSYTNSLMGSEVDWADYNAYPAMASDHAYIGLGIDLENSAVAYMSGPYGGISVNIWDGTQMLFQSDTLALIDSNAAGQSANGGSQGRIPTDWAPAVGTGSFLCWTADGMVKIKYIRSDGKAGVTNDISSGSQCAIATDNEGNIHLVYNNGGVKYRKITTTYGTNLVALVGVPGPGGAPPEVVCGDINHPSPHWGLKDGVCKPSCGIYLGLQGRTDSGQGCCTEAPPTTDIIVGTPGDTYDCNYCVENFDSTDNACDN